MKVLRAIAIAGVSFVIGCTLLVDTDGLSSPDAGDAAPEAGKDAAAIVDVGTADVLSDAAADASAFDADASAPLQTTVSCSIPGSCADREGCCVVYGGADDFCTGEASKCVFGTSKTVWVQCDDQTDCAALGEPGSICCAQVAADATFSSVTCTAPDACTGVQLCDATLKQCPAGKSCMKGKHASDIWSCE